MKYRILALFLALTLVLSLCGCDREADAPQEPQEVTEPSTSPITEEKPALFAGDTSSADFRVTFLDVGQGDAALVECDGEYMLIDAGTQACGEKIRDFLIRKGVWKLKYLVISHLHNDHYGGILGNALQNVTVERILCNEDPFSNENMRKKLGNCQYTIPQLSPNPNDHQYTLGSAKIHVLYTAAEKGNDSLVLLIRYQDTSFLFTGDIEGKAQSEVADKLRQMSAVLDGRENVIKMPHHGAYNSDTSLPDNASDNSLNALLSAAHASYFVISVGKNNQHNHPHDKTLKIIEQALRDFEDARRLLRTDEFGDIVMTSDGKKITLSKGK